jgi:hypothetical protein
VKLKTRLEREKLILRLRPALILKEEMRDIKRRDSRERAKEIDRK